MAKFKRTKLQNDVKYNKRRFHKSIDLTKKTIPKLSKIKRKRMILSQIRKIGKIVKKGVCKTPMNRKIVSEIISSQISPFRLNKMFSNFKKTYQFEDLSQLQNRSISIRTENIAEGNKSKKVQSKNDKQLESFDVCQKKLLEYDPKIFKKDNKMITIDAKLQLERITKKLESLKVKKRRYKGMSK